MKNQKIATAAKPSKTEKVKIGSTVYIVNSFNDNFPKNMVKKKIAGLIENDIAKNT